MIIQINTREKVFLFFLFLIAVIIVFTSCKKAVTVPEPTNQLTKPFENDRTAVSAVTGLYSQMMSSANMLNGGMSLLPGLSADEIISSNPIADMNAFAENALLPTNYTLWSYCWAQPYQFIYQSNACIEGINQSNQLSTVTKKQLLGEVKFTRALCYFYLLNLFGDVPLVLSTDYARNAVMPRTNKDSVYAQITEDLKEAVQLMNADYVSSGRVRPNKYAAMALLARVYLYQQDWQHAEEMADAVIESGVYSLTGTLGDCFLNGSNETIWQLLPVNGYMNTDEGYRFVPWDATVIPDYVLREGLMNAFEVNDARKQYWTGVNNVGGQDYYYPFKYKVKYGGEPYQENNIVLRLSEQYLIRAEARAERNNLIGAADDINVIRNRAGLSNTSAITKDDLLDAVMKERRVELFAEWGHRWFDLKRRGKADAVLSLLKPGWSATDELYPIPLTEIERNVRLTQNAGY